MDTRARFANQNSGPGLWEIVRQDLGASLSFDQRREREPRFDRALAIPRVSLHLYEKHKPRKGRKMGHLAVVKTPDEAVKKVMEAKGLL